MTTDAGTLRQAYDRDGYVIARGVIEPSLAQEACDAIRAAARAAGFAERKVFTVSGAAYNWSEVLGAAQALSLFSERQLIEIRIAGSAAARPERPAADGLKQLLRLQPRVVDGRVVEQGGHLGRDAAGRVTSGP